MLKLIRACIHGLEIISPALTAKLVVRLAARPMRYPWPERERAQLEQAERLSYVGSTGTDNVAWAWGSGPTVLLVHGWASRGSQMATMAMAIAEAGYRVVAMDLTGHGASKGKAVTFRNIADDVVAIAETLGELHAVVGHSAGGVMAMGARELGLKASRYAVMGAPVAPYPALAAIKKMLKVNDKTLKHCEDLFAAQLGLTWADLEQGHAFNNGEAPLLLIYDTADKEVPVAQGEKIHQLWKNSELVITEDLGHARLMWDQAVVERVVEFLKQ